nr:Glycosyltransferase [Streptococcus suis]
MKQVAIIISTYNGEQFIEQQLESLFSQTDVEISIFVRDDCSTDNTLSLLEKYSNKLTIIENNRINLGVGNSFMETLYSVGDSFDYYAFCDQDDVWLEEKLSKAIFKLENEIEPALYCSNQTLVDKNLSILGERHKESLNTSHLQILNNNKLTGCTMVWNKELQIALLATKNRPSSNLLKIRIHDVWVAMVASVIGKIIYDSNSYIYYRQHENNVVGVRKEKLLSIWRKKLFNPSIRNGRSMLASEVFNKFQNNISPKILNDLQYFVNYQNSIKYKFLLLKNSYLFKYSNEPKMSIWMKIIFNLV